MDSLNVLSIHWGFSIGGIGKYATLIQLVNEYAPVKIKSACVIGKGWQTDKNNLAKLNAKTINISSRLDFSWIFRLSTLIKQDSPDLILTHGFNGHFISLLARFVSRKPIPIVSSYHGLYHATTFGRRFVATALDTFTQFFLRHVAVDTVCVAEYSQRYLSNKNIPPAKLTVIHNGIENRPPDNSQRDRLRQEWGVREDEILLGIASRLAPVKGVTFLIEAMGLIKKDGPMPKLVIVGTGTLDQALNEQVKQLGLTHKIKFTGFRSDIDQCLGAIDIFILPSLAENHSIAIIEAMRAKKTIIATDVGGNTESVRHMKEAIIIPPHDSISLAEAIKQLMSDKVLQEKLAAKARDRFLQKFTVETMVRETADWLIDCGKKAGVYEGNPT